MGRGLAEAGANVVVAARDREKSAAAVRELSALGPEAFAVEVDVTQEESVAALIVERLGRLDVLVNNAGTNVEKPPHEYTLDD